MAEGIGAANLCSMTTSRCTHQDVGCTHQDVGWTHQDVGWTHQDVGWTHQDVGWTHQDVGWTHQDVGWTYRVGPVWRSGFRLVWSCSDALWTWETSTRLPDVDHSVAPRLRSVAHSLTCGFPTAEGRTGTSSSDHKLHRCLLHQNPSSSNFSFTHYKAYYICDFHGYMSSGRPVARVQQTHSDQQWTSST